MRNSITVLVILCVLSPLATLGQTRRRTARKPVSGGAALKMSDAKRDGARRVAEQIKALTRFIYLLGGVAKGIESLDEAVRRNEASPALLQQAQRSKSSVKSSIQSVREGLDKLEIDFRTIPELQRYYIPLAGVAAGADSAEQQAGAGQFDQAGKTLITVVDRLTAVLVAMQV